jgi:hypothetical protein
MSSNADDALHSLSSETLIMVDPQHTPGGKLFGVTLTCASGRRISLAAVDDEGGRAELEVLTEDEGDED